MLIRKWILGVTFALIAVLALTVASVGSAKPAKGQATVKVAVVTDIGGLNDKGFNALAAKGLKHGGAAAGHQGRVSSRSRPRTTSRTCSAAARQGYNPVVANGFLMGDSIAAVATQFPKTTSGSSTSRQSCIEEQSAERSAAPSSRRMRPATWWASLRRPRPRPTTSARSAARRCRPSSPSSPATRRVRRRRSRASRCCPATPRTSSTRRSARSSR